MLAWIFGDCREGKKHCNNVFYCKVMPSDGVSSASGTSIAASFSFAQSGRYSALRTPIKSERLKKVI